MDVLTTILEVLGMCAIAVGCFLVAVPLGLIVAGALALGTGVMADR